MCGRVYQTLNPNLLLRAAGTNLIKNRNKNNSSYNIGPGQVVPVVRHKSSKTNKNREIDMLKWGYPAPFGRKQLLINARSEEASGKRTFKPLVNDTRAVMIAEGYFEWTRSRQPYVYRSKEKSKGGPNVLYIACLVAKDDSVIVLTRDALKGFSDVHDRMPVLLDEGEIDKWLDLDNDYDDVMNELLNDKSRKWSNVYSYKVSRSVNSMGNDTEKNIESLDDKNKGKDNDEEEEKEKVQSKGRKGKMETQSTQTTQASEDDVDELEEDEEDEEELDDVKRAKRRDTRRKSRGKGRGRRMKRRDEDSEEEDDEDQDVDEDGDDEEEEEEKDKRRKTRKGSNKRASSQAKRKRVKRN